MAGGGGGGQTGVQFGASGIWFLRDRLGEQFCERCGVWVGVGVSQTMTGDLGCLEHLILRSKMWERMSLPTGLRQ